MAGGEPGAVGRNYVLRADGSTVPLGGTAKIDMNPGDVFIIETPAAAASARRWSRRKRRSSRVPFPVKRERGVANALALG
jgi:N-methylhydantoinase B/oxoprolinase/acetone carboxylase alpha subunit